MKKRAPVSCVIYFWNSANVLTTLKGLLKTNLCFNFYCNNNDLFAELFNSEVIYLLEGKRAKNGSNRMKIGVF